ncbi:MAG: hypothetical protein IJ506_02645 [Clostridia bacterium]|nr:hypothetical protein [Clostridia bacterium]
MIEIFYTERNAFSSTESALRKIFSERYGIKNAEFYRNEHGKPFLKNGTPFFSVSHTEKLFFVAVSSQPVGLDAEERTRKVNFLPIVKKYPFFSPAPENAEAFLREWTVFESAVKYLGESIAIVGKRLLKNDPAFCFASFEKDGHFISVCTKEKSPVHFVRF